MVDDHDANFLSFGMVLDHPGHLDPLLDIQVGARLVENIDIGIP